MRKIIAYILTLCMTFTMLAVGSCVSASAESLSVLVAQVEEMEEATPTPEAAEATPVPEVQTAAAEEPTATPAPEAQAAAAVEPTATPVSEAQETAATEGPDETVDPDATAEPDTTPETTAQSAATATPKPAATAEPNVGSGPVWITESEHRRYGDLDDLLPIAILNHKTVYICTTSVIELNGYSASELDGVGFGIDVDALGEDFCKGKTVIVSAISRSGAMRDNTLYIWIGKASDIPSASDALGDEVQLGDDEDVLETEIMVQPENYTAGETCTPTFTLTAYPDLTDGMTFAVILNDGDPEAISGSAYAPTESGEYRFAVLDAAGTLAARSMPFTVIYGTADTAEPETTDEPTVTEVPEATDEPTVTEVPETTGEPTVTETPETTGEPTVTETPEATGEPAVTDVPEATDEPTVTEVPETTGEPAVTETPEATEEPTVTETPEATAEPTATPEPEATEVPTLTEDDLADGDDAQTPVTVPELTVRAYNYVAETLSDATPFFELSGAAEGSGYTYAIAVNGGDVTPLEGDTYTAAAEGAYSFVFYLLDAEGNMVDSSKVYSVQLSFAQADTANEAWMTVNGEKVYGTLQTLLDQADSGSTIYLLTSKVITLNDSSKLSSVTLQPDSDVFGNDHCVIVSTNNPDKE